MADFFLQREARRNFALVGLGTGAAFLTDAARVRLLSSDVVFVLEPLAAAARLRAVTAVPIVSVDAVFDEEPDRARALELAAERIVSACAGYSRPALALQGHPMVSCAPARHLLRLFAGSATTVEVIAGVSSIDVFCADLGFDLVASGVQIVNGASIAYITPGLPVILLSPGYASSVSYSDRLRALAVTVSRLVTVYGDKARFYVYSRHDADFDLETIPVTDLLGLASGPRLGDVLVAGPAALMGTSATASERSP